MAACLFFSFEIVFKKELKNRLKNSEENFSSKVAKNFITMILSKSFLLSEIS